MELLARADAQVVVSDVRQDRIDSTLEIANVRVVIPDRPHLEVGLDLKGPYVSIIDGAQQQHKSAADHGDAKVTPCRSFLRDANGP